MQMYLQLQSREIDALKSELTMLKRKDVPPLPAMIPLNSYNHSQGTGQEVAEFVLT